MWYVLKCKLQLNCAFYVLESKRLNFWAALEAYVLMREMNCFKRRHAFCACCDQPSHQPGPRVGAGAAVLRFLRTFTHFWLLGTPDTDQYTCVAEFPQHMPLRLVSLSVFLVMTPAGTPSSASCSGNSSPVPTTTNTKNDSVSSSYQLLLLRHGRAEHRAPGMLRISRSMLSSLY